MRCRQNYAAETTSQHYVTLHHAGFLLALTVRYMANKLKAGFGKHAEGGIAGEVQ